MAEFGERLDKWLASLMPAFSRSRLSKLIDEGGVLVEGRVRKPGFHVEPGMHVVVSDISPSEAHDLTPAHIPLEVLYEDEFLLVVNKPRGLASHPASSLKEPSLVNALLARNTELSQVAGSFRPGIVHRLDKETTGLMIVAKDDQSHAHLAKQIESKAAERRYFVVVAGDLEQDRFVIDAPIARNRHNRLLMTVDPTGRVARTHVKRVATVPEGTVLAAKLETGRTHQIRVHLQATGHPVLGDRLYAPKEYGKGAMQLHAAYLAFDHPQSGVRVAVYAEPDSEFIGRSRVSRSVIEDF